MTDSTIREGGCTCGAVRYRLLDHPMFVHCCHCSWCQRETGTAFALNALIESDRVEILQGETEALRIPSNSGKGQVIVRCTQCRIALWSHYAGLGDAVSFMRAGTLDDSGSVAPDVHIFTSTKLPWVILPDGAPAFSGYYDPRELWPAESQERYRRLKQERS
jgi:hypothetical protein